ncbi:MAG: sel1 repeat family protein [Pseudomonadota bacterium]
MKKLLFCLSMLLCGALHADELADANALFAKKSYPQALQMYAKLANGGNAEAQLHMGEMHLYGEAGAVDLAKAEVWFKKSAAKGNKTAIAALEMMRQRELHKAELAYWMAGYDGADLTGGQYRCPAPRVPAMSKQNDEIASIGAKVDKWKACYNAFVENLNAAAPLTSRIPKDVADLMTEAETAIATAHLAQVYSRIMEDARVQSKLFLADLTVWRDATDAYVTENNRIVEEAKSGKRKY